MARPEKNTVDYFPHPSRHGKKMAYIRKKYGNDGYAAWFIILEQLGDSERHFLDLSNEIGVMYLETACDLENENLFNIINDLVKLGEFDAEIWENHQVLFSQKFINSIEDAYAKRSNKPVSRAEILRLFKVSVPVNPVTAEFPHLKGDENTQRKGKEIILKEREEKERGLEGENPSVFSSAFDVDLTDAHRNMVVEDYPKQQEQKETDPPATIKSGKKKTTQLEMMDEVVLPHDTPGFRQAWAEWLQYKTIIRDTYKSPVTMQAALKKFADHPPEIGIKAIHDSISNQWKGVFPEKARYNERNNQNNQPSASAPGTVSRLYQKLVEGRGAGSTN